MIRWAAEVELRIAIVALARKMAGIMYAIWRDGSTYEPHRGAMQSSAPTSDAATTAIVLARAAGTRPSRKS